MEYTKLKYITKFPTGKLNSNAAEKDGIYPFFTCSHEIYNINTYSYDGEYVLLGGNNATGDFPIFYYNGKFDAYQRTYLIQPINKDIFNTRYLFYVIGLRLKQMQSNAAGTATKFLTLPILNNLSIESISLDRQEIIVGILSAYDDLIENNNKRIELLENMAQELYKEWFVRFRFPGYKQTAFFKNRPKSWNVVSLREFVSIERGVSYSSEEINCVDGINLVNLKNIKAYGGYNREGIKKYSGKYRSTQVVTYKDLVMGVTDMTQDRRTVGYVALIPDYNKVSVISADLVKLNSNIRHEYLYCMFKYGFVSKYLSQFANGANVLHLKPDAIYKAKVLFPEINLINAFSDKVKGIFDILDILNKENENLKTQRDLLLPRLMSGKLEVKVS